MFQFFLFGLTIFAPGLSKHIKKSLGSINGSQHFTFLGVVINVDYVPL